MNFKTITGQELAQFRKSRGMTQSDFWNRLGVGQSGASRYEAGRRIPESVRALLLLAYGTEIQASAFLKSLRSAQKGWK